MQIILQTLIDKIMILEVEPSDTIMDCKLKIQNKTGYASEQFILIFGNHVLNDDHIISDYKIENNDKLHMIARLTSKSENSVQIFVKTLSGYTITLNVKPTDTILDCKIQIYKKEKIPPEEQKLIFYVELLNDKNTIIDYLIQQYSTLHMALRSRGEYFRRIL